MPFPENGGAKKPRGTHDFVKVLKGIQAIEDQVTLPGTRGVKTGRLTPERVRPPGCRSGPPLRAATWIPPGR